MSTTAGSPVSSSHLFALIHTYLFFLVGYDHLVQPGLSLDQQLVLVLQNVHTLLLEHLIRSPYIASRTPAGTISELQLFNYTGVLQALLSVQWIDQHLEQLRIRAEPHPAHDNQTGTLRTFSFYTLLNLCLTCSPHYSIGV